MEIMKIIGVGLVALILIIIIKQYKPEFALYISIITGIIIFSLVLDKLSGIINLLLNLSDKANINKDFIVILLKITGIAILSEFAISVCKDSGETAVASKIDFRCKNTYGCDINSDNSKPIGNDIKNNGVKFCIFTELELKLQ